jgi:iron complex outermembrane recepter protein
VIARSSQGLVGDEANLTPPVPGYAIVNLRGSINLTKDVSLFGEIRNVLDHDYATFGTFSEVDEVVEVPGASDPRAYGPGAPRRWSIGLLARF